MPEEHIGLTFWDHLGEFVKRMKVVLFTFAISVFVLLVLPGNTDFFAMTNNYAPLMSTVLVYIRTMMLPPNVKLIATSMSDPITLYVFAAVSFAVAITLPVFAYETYKFVVPALFPILQCRRRRTLASYYGLLQHSVFHRHCKWLFVYDSSVFRSSRKIRNYSHKNVQQEKKIHLRWTRYRGYAYFSRGHSSGRLVLVCSACFDV